MKGLSLFDMMKSKFSNGFTTCVLHGHIKKLLLEFYDAWSLI